MQAGAQLPQDFLPHQPLDVGEGHLRSGQAPYQAALDPQIGGANTPPDQRSIDPDIFHKSLPGRPDGGLGLRLCRRSDRPASGFIEDGLGRAVKEQGGIAQEDALKKVLQALCFPELAGKQPVFHCLIDIFFIQAPDTRFKGLHLNYAHEVIDGFFFGQAVNKDHRVFYLFGAGQVTHNVQVVAVPGKFLYNANILFQIGHQKKPL